MDDNFELTGGLCSPSTREALPHVRRKFSMPQVTTCLRQEHMLLSRSVTNRIQPRPLVEVFGLLGMRLSLCKLAILITVPFHLISIESATEVGDGHTVTITLFRKSLTGSEVLIGRITEPLLEFQPPGKGAFEKFATSAYEF